MSRTMQFVCLTIVTNILLEIAISLSYDTMDMYANNDYYQELTPKGTFYVQVVNKYRKFYTNKNAQDMDG